MGAPSGEAVEGFLPEDTRGSWRRKEEMADGVVTGCQMACELLRVSPIGILEILGTFSRCWGDVLCEQVVLKQEPWLIGVDTTSSVCACRLGEPGRVWVTHFQINKCSLLHLGRDGERYFYPVNLFFSTHLKRIGQFHFPL